MKSIKLELNCSGKCYLGFNQMSLKCLTQCSCCMVKIIK